MESKNMIKKVISVLFLLLCIACKKEKSYTSEVLPVNENNNKNPVLSTVSSQKNSSVDSRFSNADDESNKNSCKASLEVDETGLKVLQVTKIIPCKNSEISVTELESFFPDAFSNIDSTNSPIVNNKPCPCCANINSKNTREWFYAKRINRPSSSVDTGCFIYGASGGYNFDSNMIDFYYVKQGDLKSDSLIFIPTYWDCPDYKKLYTFQDYYPFFNSQNKFNYVGDNIDEIAKRFSIKPCHWDENNKVYDIFSPSLPAQDSSSLLIYSTSGFEVQHETKFALMPSENEKKLILESLLHGIQDISCVFRLTMVKLATINSTTRYMGLVAVSGLSSWYFADVKNDECEITIFEADDYYYSNLYCAYAFGVNNLPDVFVLVTDGKTPRMEKCIYYKSNNRWVVTITQEEYKGDCLEESEEE